MRLAGLIVKSMMNTEQRWMQRSKLRKMLIGLEKLHMELKDKLRILIA
jgi:hypothetical protein